MPTAPDDDPVMDQLAALAQVVTAAADPGLDPASAAAAPDAVATMADRLADQNRPD